MPVQLSSYSRPTRSSTRAEENSLDRESSANPSSDDGLEQVEDELLEDGLLEDERAKFGGIKRKGKFGAPGRETPKRAKYSVMEGGYGQGESSTRAQGATRCSSSPKAGAKMSSSSMSTPATMPAPPHNRHSGSSLPLPQNLPVFTPTLTSARKNRLVPFVLLPKPKYSYLISRKTGADYVAATAIRGHPHNKNKGKGETLRENASAAAKSLPSSSGRARDASARDVVQGKAGQLAFGAPVKVGSGSASTSASVSNAVDKRRRPNGSEKLSKANVEKGSGSGSASANGPNSDIRNFLSEIGKTSSKLGLHSPSKRSVPAPTKPRIFSSSLSSSTGFAPPSTIKLGPKLNKEKSKAPHQSVAVPQSEIIEISDDDPPPSRPRLRHKALTITAGEVLEISSSKEESAPLRARTLQSTQAVSPTRPRLRPLPRKACYSMPNADTESISPSSSDDELLGARVTSTSKSVPVSARARAGLPSSVPKGLRRPLVRLQSKVQSAGMLSHDPMDPDGDFEPPSQSPSLPSTSRPQTPPRPNHRDDSNVVMSRLSSPVLRPKLQYTTRSLPTVLQSGPSAPQMPPSSTLTPFPKRNQLTEGDSLPDLGTSSGARKSSLVLNSWMNLNKDAKGKKDPGSAEVSTTTSGASSSVQLSKASIRREKKSSQGSTNLRPLNQPAGAKTKGSPQLVSKRNPKRRSLPASKPSSHAPLSQKTVKSVAETIMLAGKLNAAPGATKSPAGLSRDQVIDLTLDDSEDEELPADLAQSSSSSHPPQEISRSSTDELAIRPSHESTEDAASPGADTAISSASVPSESPSSEMGDLNADDLPIVSDSEGGSNVDKLMRPSALRRFSRQPSSASGFSENLIPYGGDYEGAYNSPASSLAPISPVPSLDVEGGKTYAGIKAMTWAEYRKNPTDLEGKCYYSKDLPHSLQDTINKMSEEMRMLGVMRDIFRAAIRENTAEDEPDAPDIEVINDVDAEPAPPWEFHYTNKLWHGEGVPPPDIKNLISCDCIGRCDPKSKTCACLQRQSKYYGDPNPDFAYDTRGKLKHPGYPIFECNDLCGCDDECRNRVVQHGRTLPVKIAKTATKGWGVFNGPKKIHKGTFIGVYAGELLTDTESEQRGLQYNLFGRTYLFDLDFHHLKEGNDKWEIQYVVDAYHAGNFTRFVNHSCEPNSRLYACYINEANIDKPILTVFAIRDIEADEEITFSYTGYYPEEGYSDDEDEDDESASDGRSAAEKNNTAVYRSCLCGAARCKGTMFN